MAARCSQGNAGTTREGERTPSRWNVPKLNPPPNLSVRLTQPPGQCTESGGRTMARADWLEQTDPDTMLQMLGSWISERKVRLFAAGCCRRVWHQLTAYDRRAVEMAERYAD